MKEKKMKEKKMKEKKMKKKRKEKREKLTAPPPKKRPRWNACNTEGAGQEGVRYLSYFREGKVVSSQQ